MRSKFIRRLGAVSFVGFLALSVIAGLLLADRTLHPVRRPVSAENEALARQMALRHDSELTDVAMVAADGATLRAWRIHPLHSNRSAVILLHGLSDNRAGMTGYDELLLSHGFNVLMPDARAHGSSGGDLATYGLLESGDIHRWLDWL